MDGTEHSFHPSQATSLDIPLEVFDEVDDFSLISDLFEVHAAQGFVGDSALCFPLSNRRLSDQVAQLEALVIEEHPLHRLDRLEMVLVFGLLRLLNELFVDDRGQVLSDPLDRQVVQWLLVECLELLFEVEAFELVLHEHLPVCAHEVEY